MLNSGAFTTINDLAKHERIAPSYMTRVLRLTLLAPEIVEAVLDGSLGQEVTLARLLDPFCSAWADQQHELAHQTPFANDAREQYFAEDRQNAALWLAPTAL
jgi:hypothetical protein